MTACLNGLEPKALHTVRGQGPSPGVPYVLCGAEAERGLWTSEGLLDFSELLLILVCTRGQTLFCCCLQISTIGGVTYERVSKRLA